MRVIGELDEFVDVPVEFEARELVGQERGAVLVEPHLDGGEAHRRPGEALAETGESHHLEGVALPAPHLGERLGELRLQHLRFCDPSRTHEVRPPCQRDAPRTTRRTAARSNAPARFK